MRDRLAPPPQLTIKLKEIIIDNYGLPILEILEETDEDGWEQCEINNIAHHKKIGAPLLNKSDGGRNFGKECYIKGLEKSKKPILEYDLNGVFIKEWESIRRAARDRQGAKSGISASLHTDHKTALNSFWRFKKSNDFPLKIITKPREYTTKPIFCISPEGERFHFKSMREAGEKLNLNETAISRTLIKNGTLNNWKFERDLENKRWAQPHGKLAKSHTENYKLIR
jgi:hypothetical protein